ncbi:hypothetical protein DFH07DRAFT_953796 [Mycena maculata]|uniref:Secreted protein n=1 Tax=Mycena maculata TaxID=230809 RepID=A0AAD7NQI0_9AGAR|nr:hypothetical protein DFH07DRAFT_953796 [Mycena maculata]
MSVRLSLSSLSILTLTFLPAHTQKNNAITLDPVDELVLLWPCILLTLKQVFINALGRPVWAWLEFDIPRAKVSLSFLTPCTHNASEPHTHPCVHDYSSILLMLDVCQHSGAYCNQHVATFDHAQSCMFCTHSSLALTYLMSSADEKAMLESEYLPSSPSSDPYRPHVCK